MATKKEKKKTVRKGKAGENGKLSKGFSVSTVLNSAIFATVMKIAEKVSYSKSRVFRLLSHAFEKLKEESNQHRIEEDVKSQISTLMRMLKSYYRGDYRKIPSQAIMRILGGLIYFVWILDVIPDFIPILGFADDIAVIIWVYSGLVQEIEDFERWESVNAMNIDPVQNSNGHSKKESSTVNQK